MKKLSFIACFIAFTSLNLLSQVNFGLKFGVHTFDVSNAKSILIPNSSQSIEFKDAKIGFQGGIYTKFKIGSLILEPRLMLHWNILLMEIMEVLFQVSEKNPLQIWIFQYYLVINYPFLILWLAPSLI